ncbi:GroES-like protein [Panus rudis PR-1116 ss-1]|nr:GroES-like protein [Panus rudis PR-1116 ss-1]
MAAIPTQQKALIVTAPDAPPVIQTIPVRSPGPNEVLVRVEAASLSPGDEKCKILGPPYVEYPAMVGFDAAGVVVRLGEHVTNVAVGDRVIFQAFVESPFTSRHGGLQQYAISPANIVVKIPDSLGCDEASTILANLGTAFVGFFSGDAPNVFHGRGGAELPPFWREEGKDKLKNQPLLILSGASSVGQYAIQVARLAGFSPIITTASLHHTDLLKSLGATHVIDRTLPHSQLISQIRSIVPEGFKVVFDTFAIPETQKQGYELLVQGGTLVLVLPFLLDQEKAKAENKKVVFTYFWFHLPPFDKLGMEILQVHLPEWLKTGAIKPNQAEYLPGGLHGVPVGWERLRNNQVSGKKLVVHPQETV